MRASLTRNSGHNRQTLNDTTDGSNESHDAENKKKTLPDTNYCSQGPHIQESTERATNWLKETGWKRKVEPELPRNQIHKETAEPQGDQQNKTARHGGEQEPHWEELQTIERGRDRRECSPEWGEPETVEPRRGGTLGTEPQRGAQEGEKKS